MTRLRPVLAGIRVGTRFAPSPRVRIWAILLGVFVAIAVAWPAVPPPPRPAPGPVDEVPAMTATVPVSVADEEPARRSTSRDPEDPPPPPEPPPPPKPTWPCGEITGCVEDEDGCAVASFDLASRHFAFHRRRGRPAGEGEPGPGGTFRFRVRRLEFDREPVPPGVEVSRWLFEVCAPGFAPGIWRLGEDDESVLRRGGRVTGVRIVLERAVVVQGRLFLPNGHPAPSTVVTVTRKEKDGERFVRSLRTDADGWYRFDTLRPTPGLSLQAEGRLGKPKRRARSGKVPLGDDLAGGEILHVDLRLGPWQPVK